MLTAIDFEKAAAAAPVDQFSSNRLAFNVRLRAVDAFCIKCNDCKKVGALCKSSDDIRGFRSLGNRDGRGPRTRAGSVINVVPGKIGKRGSIRVLRRHAPRQSSGTGRWVRRRRGWSRCRRRCWGRRGSRLRRGGWARGRARRGSRGRTRGCGCRRRTSASRRHTHTIAARRQNQPGEQYCRHGK
jgi:hypothetical protein